MGILSAPRVCGPRPGKPRPTRPESRFKRTNRPNLPVKRTKQEHRRRWRWGHHTICSKSYVKRFPLRCVGRVGGPMVRETRASCRTLCTGLRRSGETSPPLPLVSVPLRNVGRSSCSAYFCSLDSAPHRALDLSQTRVCAWIGRVTDFSQFPLSESSFRTGPKGNWGMEG